MTTEATPSDAATSAANAVPERPFGRDGQNLPVLGLGGQSLIQNSPEDEPAVGLISRAIDLGIRYLDTSPVYGRSEERIGNAISGRRSEVFLATKTLYRRGSSARRGLERSLTRLGTDHFDLIQLHCLMAPGEISTALGRGGVVPMLERARAEGLVKHIGVTGHYHPGILADILRRYPFDSVLMPVNPADPGMLAFTRETLQAAVETGTSVVAMKVMGAGYLTHKGCDASALLRYALSWPVSLAIVSCRSEKDLVRNVGTARGFVPMSPAEMRALEAEAPEVYAHCNRIYKRHSGRRGARIALRNWTCGQLLRVLPGWWRL